MKYLLVIFGFVGAYFAWKYRELDIMARTAWGEARSDGADGMRAVMHTINNRAKQPKWWGRNIYQVATKDYQFSAWNADDPNRSQMQALDSSDLIYKQAYKIARRIVDDTDTDPTGGATHYHTKSLPFPTAGWGDISNYVETTRIGSHIFYKERNA